MAAGGISGYPDIVAGNAGTIPEIIPINNPLTNTKSFARSVEIAVAAGGNDLSVYLNADATPLVLTPGQIRKFEMTIHRLVIAATTSAAALAVAAVATDAALPAVTQAGAGLGATLTADAVGILTVDGVAIVLNDRVLVKDQVAAADNGLYLCTTEGTGGVAFVLTRSVDHDTDAEVTNADFVAVTGGTANAGTTFQVTTADPITVDTTAVTWSEFVTAYDIVMVVA